MPPTRTHDVDTSINAVDHDLDVLSECSELSSLTDGGDFTPNDNFSTAEEFSSFRRTRRSVGTESPKREKQSRGSSSVKNGSASTLKTVSINGKILRPTVLLDTLFYFIAERMAMYERRRAGLPRS